MRCDHCKQNPVSVEWNIQVNGYQKHLHLCESCYKELMNQTKQTQPTSQFSMEDFFKGFMQPSMGMASQNGGAKVKTQTGQGGRGGLLDELGKNITASARAGLIDPVIGRDKEVERVIETLNRRNKNNPVLIGEPGVGKTAIAEGLALKIIEGQVPHKLKNKEIYLLDVSSLVAGTGIRGQFEERMKRLVTEMQERQNVIVFIDEVHQIVGAGSAEGSADAGNILKPALARGEIQIIGATTLNEYRKIEKDAALERRFQPITVNEPSLNEAVAILKGLRTNYEKYHRVRYTDEALEACVTLSNRYIQDRFLPDKAIDLMDEAGSKINLLHSQTNGEDIRARLEQIVSEKEQASEREDYERAAKLRQEELLLEEELKELETSENNQAVVDIDTIEALVEAKTGIPVRKLQQDEQEKMKNLPERLNEKVIGQQEAVEKVAKAIRRNRAGFRRKNRPIGSFLFVGPTGVGKTELSKTLAEEMFGNREAMIRLDMSEYMEKHSVSKLIGSPPGYVGHEEAGQLTERVRRKPYSIILLDEIEKAHPDVQHMFLQILEDGRLTDSQGRTVSFKDTVIIMTSNAGSTVKKITVGFGADEKASEQPSVVQGLSDYFRPEFLNRFDAIVAFNALTKEHLVKIVDLMLEEVKEAAQAQNIDIEVTHEAKVKLAELGYDPTFGARPLRRVIEEQIEDAIADLMLEKEAVHKVKIDCSEDKILLNTL
ncbi:ATP-dependent Clp protease ATP-binding subunit ClpE [Pullulanibacillus pueri]|uniref:ATP-dependent Clp protease ATP-binding subunit ClpE n=1 Tax=Pullulanibacillus pueri TaxID=1437324 RepID=A0A8J2ZSZ9_9BACL|nr:ATP-dependent Clp protease ATP-binding subunit [Pullulanibacillus pueri]MBM7680366.1 ATP-dependent Clp protease ATP-binding subunit ClpE [Pullulanibacillus pueri]GGH75429.1 ATP-dependent Clp protease ATP-binding subunit ClpE [Pullulanibacillus pueri]